MKKVWILYDTQFGNGKILAESIKSEFSSDFDVKMGDVKDVSPKSVSNEAPDILILGGAIRIFRGAPKSKKWLKELNRELKAENKKVQYGTVFLTHGLPTDKVQGFAKKFLNKIKEASMIEKSYSKPLTAKVKTQKGPIIQEDFEKAKKYTQDFIQWIKI